MELLRCWSSFQIFGNLPGWVFFFWLCIRRWTVRNCSSSHLALMPESALSRLYILPTVTTRSRNSSESVIKGDTRVVPEARGRWMVSTVMGAEGNWATHCGVVWENSAGPSALCWRGHQKQARGGRTGKRDSGSTCPGRRYQGPYYPTAMCYRNRDISSQKAAFAHQHFQSVINVVWWLFHEMLLKVGLDLVTTFYYLLTNCFTH